MKLLRQRDKTDKDRGRILRWPPLCAAIARIAPKKRASECGRTSVHEPLAKKGSAQRRTLVNTLVQFTKFSLIGLSGMAVGLGALNLFMVIWRNFPMANVVAFFVAVTWNLLLNRRFTFAPTNKSFSREWFEFVTACSLGAVLNWAISFSLYYTFSFFHEQFNYAAMIGVATAYLLNFTLSRLYVFRNRKDENSIAPNMHAPLVSEVKKDAART